MQRLVRLVPAVAADKPGEQRRAADAHEQGQIGNEPEQVAGIGLGGLRGDVQGAIGKLVLAGEKAVVDAHAKEQRLLREDRPSQADDSPIQRAGGKWWAIRHWRSVLGGNHAVRPAGPTAITRTTWAASSVRKGTARGASKAIRSAPPRDSP